MDEELPEDSERAMPLVFKREGAKASIGEIFDWKPKRVVELLTDSGEQEAEDEGV